MLWKLSTSVTSSPQTYFDEKYNNISITHDEASKYPLTGLNILKAFLLQAKTEGLQTQLPSRFTVTGVSLVMNMSLDTITTEQILDKGTDTVNLQYDST